METVGFIGVGKIGLPISENLIKSGYRVLGYRRGSLADFEKIGGVPAKSPADIGKQCDIVFSCVPTVEAMDEVVNGPNGLIHSARPGQVIVELGSHPVPDKEKHVATFAKKGAAYLDGEVSGTPGMVAARKGVIYLGGDAEAAKKIEPVVKGFADLSIYFGPFGGASKVKLINNLLVSINIAAAAEAMALGLKAGVDIDAMIKAVANGSGGSTQFGIRAPWMAQRKFKPIQGSPALLSHYFGMIEQLGRLDRRRNADVRPRRRALSALRQHGSRRRQRRRGDDRRAQRYPARKTLKKESRYDRCQEDRPRHLRDARSRPADRVLHRHPRAQSDREGEGRRLSRLDHRSSFGGAAPRRPVQMRAARLPAWARRRPGRVREADRGARHQDGAQEGSRAFGRRHGDLRGPQGHRDGGVQARRHSHTRNSRIKGIVPHKLGHVAFFVKDVRA